MLKFNNITPIKIIYQGEIIQKVKGCDGEDVWAYQGGGHDYSEDYLTTVALSSGTISFSGSSSNTLSYSTDGGSTWSSPSQNPSVQVSAGNKVLWKGVTTPIEYQGVGKFSTEVEINIEGNLMSLLFGDNFQNQTSLNGYDYAFYNLFFGVEGLKRADNLILPATTLSRYAYSYTFKNCINMTTSPVLSAQTLTQFAYNQLFAGCTSLSIITCLARDTSAYFAINEWVQGVAANGTFIKASGVTWTSGIPTGWQVREI